MTPLDLVITALVAGVASYLGAYLKKKGENFATHEDINKLVDQVSAVTAATTQIEAKITRASRVYERQLDILGKLYRHLYDAQAHFQGMMRRGRTGNEAPPEAYASKVVEAIEAARDEFLDGKLLIPPELVQKCGQFFDVMVDGQLAYDLACQPAFHPTQQVHFSEEAAEVAFRQVPSILQQIYDTGRVVIHGETR